MKELEKKKEDIDQYLDEHLDELWEIALYIHDNPEMYFHEYKACEVQSKYLTINGFHVKKGLGTLDTAYSAEFSVKKGGPTIAIISEYDALEIGHACGHNLIATTALGTAISVKKFMENEGIAGTLKVIGTPAEEYGSGKVILLKEGVFDGIDAVFMMHPTSHTTRLAGECLSSKTYQLTYLGKSAHSGSHPDNGVNALSAANLFLVGAGLLRQHFKSDWRFSGIIDEGGYSAGLIPEKAVVKGHMSSISLKDLNVLSKRIQDCAYGCGKALGCEVQLEIQDDCQGRIPNKVLSDICKKEFKALKEPLLDGMPADFGGEDLGNVSRVIPICNPYMTIFPEYKISNHTEQFKNLAKSEAGKKCIQVASKAMARSIIEVYLHPEVITDAKRELRERLEKE